MPLVDVDGTRIAYESFGSGPLWVLTPGGRYSKDYPGMHEMAQTLADAGNEVLIWDRPNCGESDVDFSGPSESTMQADRLAGLLRQLGRGPAILAGGSGGSRVSILTAARHPDVTAGLALWWISGGTMGLMNLAIVYGAGSYSAAYSYGMDAVVDIPDWAESVARNPRNRDRIASQDREEFLAAMNEWMLAYRPRDDQLIPGVLDVELARLTVPVLVYRGGSTDAHHPRETSERLADLLPSAQIVDPPWGDDEWIERMAVVGAGEGSFAERWWLLVPGLQQWANEVMPRR